MRSMSTSEAGEADNKLRVCADENSSKSPLPSDPLPSELPSELPSSQRIPNKHA